MNRCRGFQWPRVVVVAAMLIVSSGEPLRADPETVSAEDPGAETEARIERLREAIHRQREALEGERRTRRSLADELDRMREELERTRDTLDQLRREADPGGGD